MVNNETDIHNVFKNQFAKNYKNEQPPIDETALSEREKLKKADQKIMSHINKKTFYTTNNMIATLRRLMYERN